MKAGIEFTVPGPPVPKARARVVRARNGRMMAFTPDKTAAYERAVRVHAVHALLTFMRTQGRAWPVDAQAYRLSCRFYRKTARGDLDNFIKAVQDALNPKGAAICVWPDDRRVTSYGEMAMYVDKDMPRTVVRVEVVEP